MSADKKSSRPEDEYIAKEEAEKVKRLQDKLKEEEEAKEKATCYMRCPKCGGHLEAIMFKGVEIDRCADCGGVWLDAGELEKLAGTDDSNIIGDLLSFFKSEN